MKKAAIAGVVAAAALAGAAVYFAAPAPATSATGLGPVLVEGSPADVLPRTRVASLDKDAFGPGAASPGAGSEAAVTPAEAEDTKVFGQPAAEEGTAEAPAQPDGQAPEPVEPQVFDPRPDEHTGTNGDDKPRH